MKAELCFRVMAAAREAWDSPGTMGADYIADVAQGGSLPAYFRQIIEIAGSGSFPLTRFAAVRDTDKIFVLRYGLAALEGGGQLSPDELAVAKRIERLDDATFPGFG